MKRVALASLVGVLLLAACGSDTKQAATTTAAVATTAAAASQDPAACAKGATVTAGTLTIATGDPTFPPYVIDDKPEAGQGFEAAVGQAIAKQLGFDTGTTKWVRTAFDAAIAPGAKDFDFNIQQYTITDDRKKVVDMSDGYYTAPQAVFGLSDSPAASAKTIADLKGLKIGVAGGTTSLTFVEDVIKPAAKVQVFDDNAATKLALQSKQIDAMVSDLPTALYITAAEIEGTSVYGQIAGSGTDQFGLLLSKDSKLTACVNLAIAALKKSGDLDKITTQWMADYTKAPVIAAS